MVAKAIKPKDFGPYLLTARIASGGMGTIYLAETHQRGERELVAVKRVHEHLTEEPKFVRMFQDEASIAARIHHPNVCGVRDVGEVEGVPFIAMPFLMGEPLSEIVYALRGQPTVDSEWYYVVTRIVADAARGLHAAHELRGEDGKPLQVVHRDVSPHNLFVGFDGVVKVLDFGVASARVKLSSTATGEVRGKFAYMAPEHLDAVGVDRRADIWSLGVVLWEAIALRRLFRADNMADTVDAVLHGAIPSLSEYRMDVPLGLEEIVFRALARNRDARFATGEELANEIDMFFAEEGVKFGPAGVAAYMAQVFPEGRAAQERSVEAVAGPAFDDETPKLPSLSLRLDEAGEKTIMEPMPPMFAVGDDEPTELTPMQPTFLGLSEQDLRPRPVWYEDARWARAAAAIAALLALTAVLYAIFAT